MSVGGETPLVVVRRQRRQRHGYHGGAWKVAYADFVTAMMAFFLVMWLLGVGTREQRAAIADYFKNPSMTPGTATMAPPGMLGPGGASDSMIKLGGARDMSHGPGKDRHGVSAAKADAMKSEQAARQREHAQLEELMQRLHAAIRKSQALAPFKDQLLLDLTPEGLRIQIVDKLNRPMFDVGSASLKPYTVKILHELGGFINKVPNHISISGHTDDAPYSRDGHYSNWELSADRANAARRALVAGGLAATRITQVVGLAAAVPFDRLHPGAPINRRISIIVMTQQAEKAALSQALGSSDADFKVRQTAAALPVTKKAKRLPRVPTILPLRAVPSQDSAAVATDQSPVAPSCSSSACNRDGTSTSVQAPQ